MESPVLFQYEEEEAPAACSSAREVVKAPRAWVQGYLTEQELVELCGRFIVWRAPSAPTPEMPGEAIGVIGQRAIHKFKRKLRMRGARFEVRYEPGPAQKIDHRKVYQGPVVTRDRTGIGSYRSARPDSQSRRASSAYLARSGGGEDEMILKNGMLLTREWAEALAAAQRQTHYRFRMELVYRRIPFGEEGYATGSMYQAGVEESQRPCRYCGTARGQLHEPFCPNEQCPLCGEPISHCLHPDETTEATSA
jgi:hypothetical protein